MSSGTIIASESCDIGSTTGCSTTPRSSAISEHSTISTPDDIEAWLTSLAAATPAKQTQPLSRPQANNLAWQKNFWSVSELLNRDGYSEKTQCHDKTPKDHGGELKTACDRSVTVHERCLLNHAVLVLTIDGHVCSRSVVAPTLTASQSYKPIRLLSPSEKRKRGRRGKALPGYLGEMNPDLCGWYLTPTYAERRMMFPIGWTGLNPLETARVQSWRQQHGDF